MFSLVTKIRRFAHLFSKDDISSIAATLSFYLLLSFFPMMIFLISLAERVNLFSPDSKNFVFSLIPDEIYIIINGYLKEAADISSSAALLSLSFFSTVWAASTGVHALMVGINKAYSIENNRNHIFSRFIAVVATFAVAVIIMLSVVFLVFGEKLGVLLFGLLKMPSLFSVTWDIFRYIFCLTSMIMLFSFLYYISFPFKRIKFLSTLPGAVFTTLGWILFSTIFSWYLSNWASYTRLYGSIGTVIATLIWLLLSCYIILIGAELNAVLSGHKRL